MTARYSDTDDKRNLTSRVFALVVLALFKFFRFLASALNPVSVTTISLGATCFVFAALAGLLSRRRRHSNVVSALAATVLVCAFDVAGTNSSDFHDANLVV